MVANFGQIDTSAKAPPNQKRAETTSTGQSECQRPMQRRGLRHMLGSLARSTGSGVLVQSASWSRRQSAPENQIRGDEGAGVDSGMVSKMLWRDRPATESPEDNAILQAEVSRWDLRCSAAMRPK